jgi:signal transduction histidine kinase
LGWGGIIALTLGGIGSWWLMRQSLKPIEQGFQQLQQFTADASHELRSPITVVKTSIEVMQNHPERIHAADVKKLAAIASATNQMTRLVEDLLLLAHTDAAPKILAVKSIPIHLDEVIQGLVDLLSPMAQAKGITLESYLPNRVFVKGDVAQLKRLFSNLVENALQYTLPGGTVTVSLFKLDRFVVTRVEDTGIGIAPEYI